MWRLPELAVHSLLLLGVTASAWAPPIQSHSHSLDRTAHRAQTALPQRHQPAPFSPTTAAAALHTPRRSRTQQPISAAPSAASSPEGAPGCWLARDRLGTAIAQPPWPSRCFRGRMAATAGSRDRRCSAESAAACHPAARRLSLARRRWLDCSHRLALFSRVCLLLPAVVTRTSSSTP